MRVHILDSTNDLHRAHYTHPSVVTSKGLEIGATLGWLRMMSSLISDSTKTHILSVFDSGKPNFRHKLFPSYKAPKPGETERPGPRGQYALVKRFARSLGFCVVSSLDYEADDIIGAVAVNWAPKEEIEEIIICSPDKDLAQVVGGKVTQYDKQRNRFFKSNDILEKFGVEPSSIPDYLAMVGDSADGIPGIPKFGPKSAAGLLSLYKRLENIPDDHRIWGVELRAAQVLAASLAAHREEALLYRSLTTLKTDLELKFTVSDCLWNGPDRDELRDLCEEIEQPGLEEAIFPSSAASAAGFSINEMDSIFESFD